MRTYIGITDGEWFEQLRRRADLEEVNFWKPGGKQRFRALQAGEPFLFKLHSPLNYIVGGGTFLYSTIVPVSLAWDSFGFANGAASFEEMCRRIEHYRRASVPFANYDIGCVLLSKPFFLPESMWIPVPADWGRGIQQGKRYDLEDARAWAYFEYLRPWLKTNVDAFSVVDPGNEIGGGYGAPALVAPRLGQGAFRVLVTDAYERRCAVTGEKVLPVLQAAHIRPFAQEGPHRIQNGLLLRSDLHTLLDKGYVTVSPELRVEVSGRLRDDFENGRDYYALHGKELRPTPARAHRPSVEFLEWHNTQVYRG